MSIVCWVGFGLYLVFNNFLYIFIFFLLKFGLQIPIFEKGYEKDPAVVAREAIQEASRNNSDVVLVDTAGRMQVVSNADFFHACWISVWIVLFSVSLVCCHFVF